jgi:hypothetical protein
MDKPLEPGVRKKGRNTYQVSTEYLKEDFEKMGPEKFKQLMKDKKPKTMKKGGLSAGQKKIASKAPPPDKIDAKDFAVLKAEKAKGRGMGLQDEKLKPGKVMKAKKGKMFDGYLSTFDASAEASTPKSQRGVTTIVGVKPGAEIGKGKKRFTSMEAMRTAKGFRTIDGKQETSSQFNKRRMELAVPKDIAKKALKATRIGKIALGIGAAGVAASQYLKSKMKKDEPKKKMVGGMAKKYSVGGGADMGTEMSDKRKKKFKFIMDRLKSPTTINIRKDYEPGTKSPMQRDRKREGYRAKVESLGGKVLFADEMSKGGGADTGRMGGGMMMQRPMGYKHGTKPGAGPLGAAGLRQPDKENIDQIIKDQKFPPISIYIEDKKKPQKPFPVPSLYNNNKKADKRIRQGEPRAKKKPSNIFGYKSGTMVKARGCKLGRTRPTKMY